MNGVINVYKEKTYTSHDVIAIIRGILHVKKIGHTGTLDPDATGVLPVCIGKATKACDLIMGSGKEYVATLRFGAETDTQDASGTVTREQTYEFDEALAREAIMSFEGEQDQIPPMYSAIKIGGVKLYDLAREGAVVDRKPRRITIYRIEILELDSTGARIRVECSKGTYIRTLCEDIGRKCGYLAHMSELCRTASGPYRAENALTIAQIKERVEAGDFSFLMGLEELFGAYPAKTVLPEEDVYLLNGNHLTYADEDLPRAVGTKVRMYTSDGVFAGLYAVSECFEDGMVRLLADTMFI